MTDYIVLGKYTQEGIKKIKDSPTMSEIAKDIEGVGGKIKDFYYTLGSLDFVVFCESPSEDAMFNALVSLGQKGMFRTETLVAFKKI
ncbi:MAG: GYD domain-containing protein [archaeon]|nr:GYD domain-containing protein [archaeon]